MNDPSEARASEGFAGRSRRITGVVRLSDAEVGEGLQRHVPEALAEAYERHSDAAHGLARRLCGSSAADDVVQEVFLRLWQAPWTYDARSGSLRSFIMMATHGRAIDLLRSQSSRRNREHTVHAARAHLETLPFGLDATASDAEIWELLKRLPATQRGPIVLAYVGGYTYREVAAALDLPPGTVKSRIRTGLARLLPLLADDELLQSPADD